MVKNFLLLLKFLKAMSKTHQDSVIAKEGVHKFYILPKKSTTFTKVTALRFAHSVPARQIWAKSLQKEFGMIAAARISS